MSISGRQITVICCTTTKAVVLTVAGEIDARTVAAFDHLLPASIGTGFTTAPDVVVDQVDTGGPDRDGHFWPGRPNDATTELWSFLDSRPQVGW
ncbi:hypothetical protein ACTG9Q_27835 [Actinokineospora sp. 24-640]